MQRSSKASRNAPETSGSAPAASRPARIIAVANQKGGVGKSTTAVSLGASLAELGHRVLVVDLDPQGNASTGLGIRHEQREVTVYDVLADEAPIEQAIVPTPIDNLFAIPSTIDLAGAEIELVSQFSRELRLKKAIEPLKHGAYDYVFLDCPPSLGLLTVNALAAAEELIVPIQCEYYALEGLGQLLRNVRLVQQNVNTGLRLTGIVMTMYDPRTKLSEQVVAEVRRYFGDRVYQTVIPRTVRLSEAPGFGQPINVYDPTSKGARSYRDLAREVAARLPDERPLPNVDDVPSVTIPRPEQPPSRAPRPL
ncbi:MAG TPA: ParA family protein, partial [Actinomycetota bacterium]